MEVIVDGITYQSKGGGISRIFSEILPRMCEVDNSLCFTLLTSGKWQQSLPTHPQIYHRSLFPIEKIFQPGRLWGLRIPRFVRESMQHLMVGNGRGKIWHSTHYTMLNGWKGFTIVTVYDLIHELFAHLFEGWPNDDYRKQKQRCIQAADAIICISDTTRQDVQQFYNIDQNKLYTIGNGYSSIFKPLVNRANVVEPFLLYVGGRVHYKNFVHLLRAYSLWSSRNEVKLVVVGSEWSKNEKEMLLKLGVINQVQLLTKVTDEHLCLLYNQAIAFIYPSLYEGFGIPLLEAMACGCPVIASRIPSTLEIAGECPIYFEPTNIDSLVTALDVVMVESRESERVKAGFERIKNFSWDKTAKQTLDVYHALSDSN